MGRRHPGAAERLKCLGEIGLSDLYAVVALVGWINHLVCPNVGLAQRDDHVGGGLLVKVGQDWDGAADKSAHTAYRRSESELRVEPNLGNSLQKGVPLTDVSAMSYRVAWTSVIA